MLTISFYHSDARVMWDQKTGRSRGFGFVSFRNQQVFVHDLYVNRLSSYMERESLSSLCSFFQDAQSAINDSTGENF